MKRSIPQQIAGLAGWLVLTFATGLIGALASANARDFYAQLAQPAWAPPGWLFAPVWSTLYVLMGVAAWLVWRARPAGGSRMPLLLFVIQLALNALWTWLFFVWKQGALAFIEIILLWALIVLVTVSFRRVRVAAAVLMLPYLAWVSFATALTLAVWQINPGLL